MMRVRVLVIVCAAIIYVSALPAALAANLTGKVVVSSKLQTEVSEKNKKDSKHTFYWNLENGILPIRADRLDLTKDIAVVLFKADTKESKPDKLKAVKVHAGAMERNVVVTRPGSTIRFRNVDPLDHELYCPDMPNFKPERQSNGSFRPIRFETEGIFEVRCKLVPHFKGYVVVTKGIQVIPVNGDGTFALSNVSEGKYTLKVFLGGEWIHKQSFKVPDDRRREVKLQVKLVPGKPSAKKATKK
jgi:plastocyanin